MTSLSHVHHGAAIGSAGISPINAQALTAIVVGVAVLAAAILLSTPISQSAAALLVTLVSATTVGASRVTTDHGAIAAALLAVVAILFVQLAPTTEFVALSRIVLGTLLGGLLATTARLTLRQA